MAIAVLVLVLVSRVRLLVGPQESAAWVLWGDRCVVGSVFVVAILALDRAVLALWVQSALGGLVEVADAISVCLVGLLVVWLEEPVLVEHAALVDSALWLGFVDVWLVVLGLWVHLVVRQVFVARLVLLGALVVGPLVILCTPLVSLSALWVHLACVPFEGSIGIVVIAV